MQLKYDAVTITIDESVAVVTFSRPPENFFDIALITSLAKALEAIDQEDSLRSVVLRSEGRVFCAGANFSGNPEIEDDYGAYLNGLYDNAARLFRTSKPIVVAVQGAAIGGGLGLSMIGDFRVAAEQARFSANFVKLGFHPGFGLTYLLPKLIGFQNATRLLYTGSRLTGEQAHAIGLVDEVVPLEELDAASLALAKQLAEVSPLGLETTRATMREGIAQAVLAQTKHERAVQLALSTTEDFKEGVRAVSERRPGNWLKR